MYETENDNDVAVLMAVIETAADAIDTEGVIRLLCELTDARETVRRLRARNAELEGSHDRLVAEVQPLLVGDSLAATARVYRDSRSKTTAIKALRSYTGLGIREAKLAVEQVIKIVEMKEATD